MTDYFRWAAAAVQYEQPREPAAGPWEDDEPGGDCSACKGFGYHTDAATDTDHDCHACDGTGVAS